MTDHRLIGLAAGGTGGHMFPAEALAEEMRARGWRIILFTDERGMRYGNDFPADIIETLPAANPNVRGVASKLTAGVALIQAAIKSIRSIKRHNPNIIVGFGGYPSAPAMLAARILKVPHGVHEQNAVLGRVNRLVAPKADFVAHAFSELHRLPANCRGRVIALGNPVRAAISAVAPTQFVEPTNDGTIDLFVFGGSQGASLFSRVVPAAIRNLPEKLRHRLRVTQQVRESELQETKNEYEKSGINAELKAFFDDMPQRFARAHLVISRAGASSVTEIAAVGRPAILVPLGIAMDDHQTGNAEVLVRCGAAELIAEKEFNSAHLAVMLEQLLTDPARLSQMATHAVTVAPEDATADLANLVEQLVSGQSKEYE